MSITWSFYETSCVAGSGTCTLPSQPFVLANLTLPGPDSSGSAVWNSQEPPVSPPTYTGDPFSFSVPSSITPLDVSSSFAGTTACTGKSPICDFNISWTETAGTLTAVDITVENLSDGIQGLLTDFGRIGSMDTLGGCIGQCAVRGFWADAPATPTVSEPGTLALLMVGLAIAAMMRSHYLPSYSRA